MARPPLPAFIGDLVADRRAAGALLASMAALLAAGLDPKVYSAMATTTQAAIRARPELEGLALLVSVTTAVLVLVGGAVGDSTRVRPLVLGGLAVSLVCAVVAMPLVGSGAPFFLVRLVGVAGAAIVMPASLAVAATAYSGVARATAIGIAYAAYGAGQGISPTLVALLPDRPWPAFAASIAACVLALWLVRRWIPDLPRPDGPERRYVAGTALWAIAVVLLTSGLIWFGSGWDNPLRVALVGSGIAVLVAFALWERRRREAGGPVVPVDRRPVTIALFVGFVIAFAQVIPMSQLPLYFSIAQGYGPVFGMVALAPLFLALVAAGPVAGFLLTRYQPRHLIAGGVLAVGLGDLAIALVLGPRGSAYAGFIIPLLLVGAGFVIATTVRTAIIFASVPRGMPATAAALNEASIEVGTRAGLVVITALLATSAMGFLSSSLAGRPPSEVEAMTARFAEALTALGTPSFAAIAATVDPAEVAPFMAAWLGGIRVVLVAGGLLALVGAAVTWATLGRRNPLATVYEHRDEREGAAG